MTEEHKNTDRSSCSSDKEDLDVSHLTPGERMGLAWQLTVEAWAKKGIDISQQRLRKDVVHILRRRK